MVDYARAIWRPSPNFWQGRNGHDVRYIVMHGTDGLMPGCLDWLASSASDASVHYLVDQTGAVYQLVAEQDSAWGNGIPEPQSQFVGGDNPNYFTISIEHERGPGNTTPITQAQEEASEALVADIRSRHGAVPLIPHSAISPQSRGACPGPNFPIPFGIAPVDAAPQDITWVPGSFTATPMPAHLPLPFYFAQSLQSPLLYKSKATAETVLTFDGWKFGDAVLDESTGQQDQRWYHRAMPGYGWTPSAYVNGNAPNSSPTPG